MFKRAAFTMYPVTGLARTRACGPTLHRLRQNP